MPPLCPRGPRHQLHDVAKQRLGDRLHLLAEAGIGQSASGASTQSGEIVWHTTGAGISDTTVRQDATTMLAAVAALPGVEAVVSPYTPTGARQINPSVNTAFASVVVDPTADITQIRATADTTASTSVQVAAGGQAFTTLPAPSHGMEGVGLLAALVVLVAPVPARMLSSSPVSARCQSRPDSWQL